MSEYSEYIDLMNNYTSEWLKDVLRVKSGADGNDPLKKDMIRYLATNLYVLVDSEASFIEEFFGPDNKRTELYYKLMDLWTIVTNQIDPVLTERYIENFDKSFVISREDVKNTRTKYPFLVLFPSLRKEGLLRLLAQ